MDEFKAELENGEEILWTGTAKRTPILDKTNRTSIIIKFVVSYGITLLLLIRGLSMPDSKNLPGKMAQLRHHEYFRGG